MPALLAAFGAAFAWLVKALIGGFASLATQKAVRMVMAAFLMPLFLSWIARFLGAANPLDVGAMLGTFLGGLPASILWVLDSFGFIFFVFVMISTDLGIFAVSLYARVFGAGK